jgi:phosphate transport system substrate-binding protein
MKEAAEDWESNDAAGTIIVGGSTSVQPLMEEIKEEYVKLGGTVEVDIQGQGSGEGETMVVSGTYQIGMVSREVRVDTIQHETLAIDGIAVIVNSANPITNITLDDLKEVFLGNFEKWAEV